MKTTPVLGFGWRTRVQFDDLDPQGVLHNTRYAAFVERAVSALLSANGWSWNDDDASHPDRWHLVRSFGIEHQRPILGTADLVVDLERASVGRSSTTHDFTFYVDGVRAAEGTRTIVRVDRRTGRPTPWTEAWCAWHRDVFGTSGRSR